MNDGTKGWSELLKLPRHEEHILLYEPKCS